MRPKISPSKSLAEVCDFLGIERLGEDVTITGVASDSRSVEVGDIFLALPGERAHGSDFIEAALERGARAILTDESGRTNSSRSPLLVVSNPRSICGPLADWFYGSPSRKVYVTGVTGTNGKTTTTHLIHQIWRSVGRDSGLVGTVGIKFNEQSFPTTHTTPESEVIQQTLAAMVEAGIKNVAMEASSHAIHQRRLSGTRFSSVGFTNLTQDHLDYHGNMESYYKAKRALFSFEYADQAFIVIDGEYGNRLATESEVPVQTLSITGKADWYIESLNPITSGYSLAIRSAAGVLIEGEVRLVGEHNLENLLLAVSIASDSGVDPIDIANAMPSLTGAPGRLELVNIKAPFTALVDYAHTPDAVTRILQTLRTSHSGRLIAVLGCGGDRDRSKRPLMGKALNDGCDIPIFTSDNPRSEDPDAILKEMTEGLALQKSAQVIVDRRDAIRSAVSMAGEGDVVIVLGKGHETGQEINGLLLPFDDREELKVAFSR